MSQARLIIFSLVVGTGGNTYLNFYDSQLLVSGSMHTVELKCTVPVGHPSDTFFSNAKKVRDHFSREGSCQIVNNWSDVIISEGQKVIQYTIVLKFDDQMVANSVKQKYNNKIIQGTRVYADWYNTAESKKKKKKPQTTDQLEVEDFEITLEDEMEKTSYATVSSFEMLPAHESVEKSSSQLYPATKRLPDDRQERQASPKLRGSSQSHTKSRATSHPRSSSRLSRDSDSMSVSPTPRSSYREHGGHIRSHNHHPRTPSWSPTRHSIRSTSSQDSSPIRDRKQERYLDPAASLNDDKRSTRSSISIADRMKYRKSYHSRAKNTRSSKSRKERSLTPSYKRSYKSERKSVTRNRRLSSHSEDREVELDDDYRAKKMDRSKEATAEVVSVSEANDEGIADGFADGFAGTQQCMNAFDLLQPTIEHQLRSGPPTIDSDSSEDESAPVDYTTCKAMIMKDYIERAKILTSTCNMLASQDPSIVEHLRYSLHQSLMKYGQMYIQGIQHEFQRQKKN